MRELVIQKLQERGVTLQDIGELVHVLQQKFQNGITVEECTRCVHDVLAKREVQYAFLTGIAIDTLTEKGLMPEPLQSVLAVDEPLYGVDETMALGITNVYGSIGLTNFGFLDRQKIGVLERLDREQREGGRCHTFLDDLLAGLAAAAAARLAHSRAADGVANGDTVPCSPLPRTAP